MSTRRGRQPAAAKPVLYSHIKINTHIYRISAVRDRGDFRRKPPLQAVCEMILRPRVLRRGLVWLHAGSSFRLGGQHLELLNLRISCLYIYSLHIMPCFSSVTVYQVYGSIPIAAYTRKCIFYAWFIFITSEYECSHFDGACFRDLIRNRRDIYLRHMYPCDMYLRTAVMILRRSRRNSQPSSVTHQGHQILFLHRSSITAEVHAGPAQQDSRRLGRVHPVVSRVGRPRWDTCGALPVFRVLPVLLCSTTTPRNSGATLPLLLLCIEGFGGVVGRSRHSSCMPKRSTAMAAARGDRSPTGGQFNGGQWGGVRSAAERSTVAGVVGCNRQIRT